MTARWADGSHPRVPGRPRLSAGDPQGESGGQGAAAGVGCALWLNRLMQGLLYGVSPADPFAFSVSVVFLCVVGLAGWRTVVDRKATTGWQPDALGGVPVYVMPNTSGLNASTQLAGFVAHLQTAIAGP